jgi:hypothetical protein
VDAFVKDTRPDAYARLVDRLLGSTAYGEHMAAYWMNLARWADTDRLSRRPSRSVLVAIPRLGDRCVSTGTCHSISSPRGQIAGDLLPNATKEQRLATAFLRVGPRTTENGAIDEEYRIESVIDKTNTIGAAFLGMTVGCARCHDHKYDVISHKDYYSLAAFFNNSDEPGFYPPGHSTVQAGPTLPWADKVTEAKLNEVNANIRKLQTAYDAARKAAVPRVAMQVTADLQSAPSLISSVRSAHRLERQTVAYYPFDEAIAYTRRQSADAAAASTGPGKSGRAHAPAWCWWRACRRGAGGGRRCCAAACRTATRRSTTRWGSRRASWRTGPWRKRTGWR